MDSYNSPKGCAEGTPLYETHCKPRSGAAVGVAAWKDNVPRSGTCTSC